MTSLKILNEIEGRALVERLGAKLQYVEFTLDGEKIQGIFEDTGSPFGSDSRIYLSSKDVEQTLNTLYRNNKNVK